MRGGTLDVVHGERNKDCFCLMWRGLDICSTRQSSIHRLGPVQCDAYNAMLAVWGELSRTSTIQKNCVYMFSFPLFMFGTKVGSASNTYLFPDELGGVRGFRSGRFFGVRDES